MNHSHIQDSYVELKLKLIKLAVDASKNMTTFALLEEMIELQGQFCYSENELLRYNNDILALKCSLLCKKLKEHLADLADYGITDRKLFHFEQTIEDFKLVASHHTAMLQETNTETATVNVITVSN